MVNADVAGANSSEIEVRSGFKELIFFLGGSDVFIGLCQEREFHALYPFLNIPVPKCARVVSVTPEIDDDRKTVVAKTAIADTLVDIHSKHSAIRKTAEIRKGVENLDKVGFRFPVAGFVDVAPGFDFRLDFP